MFRSILNWLWFHPQALEKELNDEACAYFGCCGFETHKVRFKNHNALVMAFNDERKL